tara:strand:+ start:7936 stop:8712 length:777 start_codon:yes stop_codon:yes gene_type:complete
MPTKYFEHFPRIDYDIEQNNRPKNVIDIMRRVGIRGDFNKYLPTYYKEVVHNDQRPDLFAFDMYEHTYYHWVNMMLNNIVDPYHDWVMQNQVLEQHIDRKYPDRSISLVNTHFSDTTYGAVDSNVKRFFVENETVNEYQADGTKLDATGTVKSFQASLIQLNISTTTPVSWNVDNFVKGEESGAVGKISSITNEREAVHHYENSDGIQVGRTATGATAVTNADFEVVENDKKREVLTLREQYLPQFENELKRLLTSAD